MYRGLRKIVSWSLLFVMMISVNVQHVQAIQTNIQQKNEYYDIKEHWAEKEISRLISENIVNETIKDGVTVIGPDNPITRAEFTKLAVTSLSSPEMAGPDKTGELDTFTDIKDHWAAGYISKAYHSGIIDGYDDGTFKPDKPISRAEAVKIIVESSRMLNEHDISGEIAFSDVNAGHWAYGYILKAKVCRLIQGYPGNSFKPQNTISRAESMVMIDRSIDHTSNMTFAEALKEITIEADKNDVMENDIVSFTVSDNDLKDKLNGIKRADGLSYEIHIKVNGKVVGKILPGQQKLDVKVLKDMSGAFVVEIVAKRNSDQLKVIAYTGHDSSFDVRISKPAAIYSYGTTHSGTRHDTVIKDALSAPVVSSELEDNNVRLFWEAVADVDSYTVKRGERTGNYTILATVTSTEFIDRTRVPNTTYYYVVTANNAAGPSANSNEIVFKTIPQAPRVFGSMDGTNGNINWSYANGANYYSLYRSTVKGGPYYAIVENTINNSCHDTRLNAGTTYYYVVKAINEIGESDYSNELAIGAGAETKFVFNPSIDDDGDGINNDDELLYGTRIYDDDTDKDGMTDGAEIQAGTDPLDPDTDGDGIYDGAEQVLGTDPLTANTDSSSTKEAHAQSGRVRVSARGGGNLVIAPLQVTEIDNVLLESLAGIVGKPADITSGGFDIDSAVISFTYDEEELGGIDENDLTIFYVNPNTMQLEPLADAVADPETNTVTGTTTHLSIYLLGDKNMQVDLSKIDIVFAIDQSGSMSSNDPNHYRIRATERFVEEMDENNNRAGLVQFESYGNIKSKLTNDKSALLSILSGMRKFGGGTNIADGIKKAASLFEDDVPNSRVIILLTDGQSDRTSALREAESAAVGSVIINTVALGTGADTVLLEQIASKTKGGYFYINDEGGLSQEDVDKQIELIYKKLAKQLTFTSIAEENDALPRSIVDFGFSDLYKGYDSKEVEDWITTASSNLLTGNYVFTSTDMAMDGPGSGITIDRTYNSFSTASGLFGTGFSSNIESRIEKNDSDLYGTVIATSLNVRSSAGVKSNNRIGQISKGTEVEILDKNAGGTAAYPWYRIKYRGTEAYVAGWYISEKEVLHVTYPSGSRIIFNYNDDKTMAVSGSTDDVMHIGRHPAYMYEVVKKDRSTYCYDSNGRLKACTDRYGNTVSFEYDAKGRITKIKGAFDDRYLAVEYNSQSLVSKITDPLGRTVSYTYDSDKNMTAFTDMGGGITRYDHHNGRIQKITDANGHQVTRNDYDILGRLVRQYDGQNNIKYFIYDDIIDEENSISARYIIDENGNESKVTFGPGLKPITVRDALGGTTTYTYYYKNETTDSWVDISTDVIIRDGGDTEYTDAYKEYQYIASQGGVETRETAKVTRNYDLNGNKSDIVIQTTVDRDKNGNIVRAEDANGYIETYVYDEYDNLISQTDKRGGKRTYTYEKLLNVDGEVFLTKTTDPLGNTTTYGYYEPDSSNGIIVNGLLKSVTDEAGDVTLYGYDSVNNFLSTVTDAEGNVITYTYDIAGRKLTETDGNGNTLSYTYDGMDRLTAIRDPYGKTMAKTYDKVGNVIEETDYKGNVTKHEYDEENRLTKVVNATDDVITYGYDPYGNRVRDAYPNGSFVEYEYDALNRVVRVEDALGNITEYKYDSTGNRISEKDASGRVTTYVYDKLGRVIRESAPEGRTMTYTYDANGNINTLRDARGYTTAFTYDALDRQINMRDASGHNESVTYLDKQKEIRYTDKAGKVTTITQDGLGRTIRKTDPMGQTESYTYDANGNILTMTDAKGTVMVYEHDKLDRVIKESVVYDPIYRLEADGTVTDSGGATVEAEKTYTYDDNGNKTTETDSLGNTTAYSYDALDRLVQITYADASIYTCRYDSMGNVINETDQKGNATTYEYDLLGRKVKETDPGANTVTYTYDAVGNILATHDANGNATRFFYDGLNRVTRITDAKGCYESMTYDASGNNISKTDKKGNKTTYAYDALNRLTTTTDPYGNSSAFTYDAVGNLLKTRDALGCETSYTYDALNRKTAMRDPEGGVESYGYDETGNRTSVTNRNNDTTTYTYDALGRLAAVTDPEGTVTRYTYDIAGNMTSQTNGEGHTARYVYDALYRCVRQIDALGGQETYTYDAVGCMTSKTDRNGNTTTYTYYDNNLLKSESLGSISYSYTYDGVGNLLTVTGSAGTTAYTYDAVYNLISEALPNGRRISYTYDAAGNKLTVTDPTGKTTAYTYDMMNRMMNVSTPDGINTYSYDANGNRTQLMLANGSYTTYQYDRNNQLTVMSNYVKMADADAISIAQSTPSAVDFVPSTTDAALMVDMDSLLMADPTEDVSIDYTGHTIETIDGTDYLKSTYTYSYDANGYQMSKTEPKGMTLFEYDRLGRVTKVTEPDGRVTTYTYDKAGNRSTQTVTGNGADSVITYMYDSRNRLLQTVEVRNGITTTTDYTYDSNGNQTAVSETTDGTAKTSFYEYDGLNRLIKTTTADGQTIESTYDHNRLRTSKTVDGVRTDFYYEGIELITEMTDQGASSYINGINLIAIQGQDTLYYIYNGHGDVVAIADGEGAITNQYDYDIFGNVILSTEGHRNTRKYAGYYYDEETGHYYLNARYYDPKTARFITQDTYKGRYSDPLSLNLYTYCYNNPIIYWDPTGHIAWYDAINLRREINAYRSDESYSNKDIVEILTDIRNIHMKYCAEDVFALSDIHKDLLNIDYAKKNLEYVKFYKGDTKYAQQKYDAALRNAFNREMKAAGHKGTGNLVTLQNLDDFGFYMGSTPSERQANLAELNRVLQEYNINTPLRIAFFLGQVAHESSFGSRTLEKFNGSSPETYFNNKYSNNSDLGNKGGNDGELFRGSGYIQITGRDNYQRFANYIKDQSIMKDGYRLIGGVYNKPVSQIKPGELGVIDVGKYAWEAAGWFWEHGSATGKDLNNLADNKDYRGVLNGINSNDTGSLQKRNSNTNTIYKILTGSKLGLPK